MSIFSNECEKCGAQVKKRARFCSTCGQPGPKAWVKCTGCNKWIGAESEFCPHCKKPQHVEERNLISNNQIHRESGVFIQRIDVDDIRSQMTDYLIIEHGTCVVFMENGKISKLLTQGKHSLSDSFLKSVFTLGSKSFKSFFVVESGDIALPFEAVSLHSQEDMKLDLYTEAVFRFDQENGANLIENLLKDRRKLTYDELGELLNAEILDSIKSLTNVTSIDSLIKDSNIRLTFENKLSDKLSVILQSIGIKLHRIASIDFYGEDYERLRNLAGDIELKARETALNQRLKELMVSEKMNHIKSEFDLKMYEEQLIHEYNVNKEMLSFERQEIINDLKEKLLLKQNEFNRAENLKDHCLNREIGIPKNDTKSDQKKQDQGIGEETVAQEGFRSQLLEDEPPHADQSESDVDGSKDDLKEEGSTEPDITDTEIISEQSNKLETRSKTPIVIIAGIIAASLIVTHLMSEQEVTKAQKPSSSVNQKASVVETLETPKPKNVKQITSELEDTEDELEKLKQSYNNLETLRSEQMKDAVSEQNKSNSAMKDIEQRLTIAQAELETRDSDKDGILDKVEKRLNLDPNNPNDALQDSDKDGFSNKAEILGAEGRIIFDRTTDHTDPADHPALAHRLKLLEPQKDNSLFEVKEIIFKAESGTNQTATIEHYTKDGRTTISLKVGDSFTAKGTTYTIQKIDSRKKMVFNKALWKEIETVVGEVGIKAGEKKLAFHVGETHHDNDKSTRVIKDSFTNKTYEVSSDSSLTIGDSDTGIENYTVSKIAKLYIELIDNKTKKSYLIHE